MDFLDSAVGMAFGLGLMCLGVWGVRLALRAIREGGGGGTGA